MSQTTLLQRTIFLVAEVKKEKTIREIAEACEVNPNWLDKFSRNRIKNPGIVHVERVYKYSCEFLGVKA